MLTTLKDEGHKGNILDVEYLISSFSDYIVIVLESPSAFAELGAFSHNTLRNKLIVINDRTYRSEESFINLGPIKAIEESADGKKRILHYKMNKDGIHNRDAIGSIFHQIYELFRDPIKQRSTPISLDEVNPARKFNKQSAMFVHDLVYLTGPIKYRAPLKIHYRRAGGVKNELKMLIYSM